MKTGNDTRILSIRESNTYFEVLDVQNFRTDKLLIENGDRPEVDSLSGNN